MDAAPHYLPASSAVSPVNSNADYQEELQHSEASSRSRASSDVSLSAADVIEYITCHSVEESDIEDSPELPPQFQQTRLKLSANKKPQVDLVYVKVENADTRTVLLNTDAQY